MSKATHRNTVAAAAALAACVALAGCSGPLSAFAGPKAGVGEALAAKTAALSPKVTSTISKGVLTVGIDTQDSMVPLYVGSSSGKAYGMDVDLASALADVLVRRSARDQRELGRDERAANLAGTVGVVEDVRGLRLLLVDDVITTGATVREAARALLARGALAVSACSLARVW